MKGMQVSALLILSSQYVRLTNPFSGTGFGTQLRSFLSLIWPWDLRDRRLPMTTLEVIFDISSRLKYSEHISLFFKKRSSEWGSGHQQMSACQSFAVWAVSHSPTWGYLFPHRWLLHVLSSDLFNSGAPYNYGQASRRPPYALPICGADATVWSSWSAARRVAAKYINNPTDLRHRSRLSTHDARHNPICFSFMSCSAFPKCDTLPRVRLNLLTAEERRAKQTGRAFSKHKITLQQNKM